MQKSTHMLIYVPFCLLHSSCFLYSHCFSTHSPLSLVVGYERDIFSHGPMGNFSSWTLLASVTNAYFSEVLCKTLFLGQKIYFSLELVGQEKTNSECVFVQICCTIEYRYRSIKAVLWSVATKNSLYMHYWIRGLWLLNCPLQTVLCVTL